MSPRRREHGYVALLTALFLAALFSGLTTIPVDVARIYPEAQRVQRAADAAALAGVTNLPSDLARAKTTVLAVSQRIGSPTWGTSQVGFSFPGSTPTDTTTWSAGIEGDPVSLVR